jgi:tRNA threonylcarbamoyladenosine biosynthesis protein TsaB
VILAVDTTHQFGSIALSEGDRLLEEVPLHSPDGFGHILFDQIQRLLERHGVPLAAVDCFAAASGPGSFTGVRIGLACVKGLAEATGKRVAGVSNLQAIAAFGNGPLRAVLLDARRGEIYGAVYDASGGIVQPETVQAVRPWLESLPAGVEFVSPDFGPFRDLLVGKLTEAPRSLAAAVARIATKMHFQARTVDPAALDANYVRRPDAELLWKDNPGQV